MNSIRNIRNAYVVPGLPVHSYSGRKLGTAQTRIGKQTNLCLF